jgi:hypothetical protein
VFVYPVVPCIYSTGNIALVGRGLNFEAKATSGLQGQGLEPRLVVAFAVVLPTVSLCPHPFKLFMDIPEALTVALKQVQLASRFNLLKIE